MDVEFGGIGLSDIQFRVRGFRDIGFIGCGAHGLWGLWPRCRSGCQEATQWKGKSKRNGNCGLQGLKLRYLHFSPAHIYQKQSTTHVHVQLHYIFAVQGRSRHGFARYSSHDKYVQHIWPETAQHPK